MIKIFSKYLDYYTINFYGGEKKIKMNETVNLFANLTPLFIFFTFFLGGG